MSLADLQNQGQAPLVPSEGRGKRIEYRGISKTYGRTSALKPTDLTIEAGEFFAIIGPSGSGKTTPLGLTAGFVAASGGDILIDGRSTLGVPPFRRNIGMVFQNYSLFLHKTVAQNIAFPLRMRNLPKAEIDRRVSAALAQVRLSDMGDRLPSALSGGQQQRVAFARATVYDPSLLVMDEPLSALDKNLREGLQFEIKQLHAKVGSTVLYVTHDQSEAAAMADRIAIMNHGEIVQIGTAKELYNSPRNRFVAAFLGNANLFAVTELSRRGTQGLASCAGGLTLHTTLTPGLAASPCICVRPEAITLTPVRVDRDNMVTGQVVDSVFSNGIQRHKVLLASGEMVEQHQHMNRESFAPRIGETVFLGWNAQDSLVIDTD
jgi:putative spermidine/putrescine transport system ATP-binding protein